MAMMSSPVQPGCSPVSRRRTHVNPERRAAPPHARAAGPLSLDPPADSGSSFPESDSCTRSSPR